MHNTAIYTFGIFGTIGTFQLYKSDSHHCIESIIYLQTYDPMVFPIPERLVRLNNQIHLLSNTLVFLHHVNVQRILCIHNNRQIKMVFS